MQAKAAVASTEGMERLPPALSAGRLGIMAFPQERRSWTTAVAMAGFRLSLSFSGCAQVKTPLCMQPTCALLQPAWGPQNAKPPTFSTQTLPLAVHLTLQRARTIYFAAFRQQPQKPLPAPNLMARVETLHDQNMRWG